MDDIQGKEPWKLRVYGASRRLLDVSIVTARAVFTGTWLGLLSRESLHAGDALYYRRARMYHTDAHNLSGLFPWEADAIDRYFSGCRALLVTSAGGGREAVALERRGFGVFAFECHPELVHVANELLSRERLNTRVALVARDECPVDMPTCDGVVVGWASYMLIHPRSVRIRFLKQLRAHVPSGAPLLLSFFARQETTSYLRLSAAIANGFRWVSRRERVEEGDDLVPNLVHHFSEQEITAELQAGGFRLVEFSGTGYPHAIAQAT